MFFTGVVFPLRQPSGLERSVYFHLICTDATLTSLHLNVGFHHFSFSDLFLVFYLNFMTFLQHLLSAQATSDIVWSTLCLLLDPTSIDFYCLK